MVTAVGGVLDRVESDVELFHQGLEEDADETDVFCIAVEVDETFLAEAAAGG